MDSEPEQPSLLHFLSVSESDGDLQTDCSYASSVGKVSGRSNEVKYLETILVMTWVYLCGINWKDFLMCSWKA